MPKNEKQKSYSDAQRWVDAEKAYRRKITTFSERNFRSIPGMDRDDMASEMLEVLWRCTLSYDPDRGAVFNTMFWTAVHNRYANLVKHAWRDCRKANSFNFRLEDADVREIVRAMLIGNVEDEAMANIEIREHILRNPQS